MNKDDRILVAALSATAGRLAVARGDVDALTDELRQLARGRRDLIIHTAGIMGGAWSVEPTKHWRHPLAVGLLIVASDGYTDGMLEAIELGRDRASQIGPYRR